MSYISSMADWDAAHNIKDTTAYANRIKQLEDKKKSIEDLLGPLVGYGKDGNIAMDYGNRFYGFCSRMMPMTAEMWAQMMKEREERDCDMSAIENKYGEIWDNYLGLLDNIPSYKCRLEMAQKWEAEKKLKAERQERHRIAEEARAAERERKRIGGGAAAVERFEEAVAGAVVGGSSKKKTSRANERVSLDEVFGI